MKIKAVLFDLDDTLYARDPLVAEWAREFVAAHLGLPDEEARRAAVRAVIEADGRGYTPKPAMLARIKSHYPALEMEAGVFAEQFFNAFIGRIALDGSVDRLLRVLEASAIPFGIVTNGGSQVQRRKVRQLDLTDRAACLVISEEFGCKKPDPSIFLAAAEAIGAEPEAILFVGDNPRLDIAGAEALGMRTAWAPRGLSWPEDVAARPDWTVDSLADLVPVVERGTFPAREP
jgi:putative hydrolase of the HAD superfamily